MLVMKFENGPITYSEKLPAFQPHHITVVQKSVVVVTALSFGIWTVAARRTGTLILAPTQYPCPFARYALSTAVQSGDVLWLTRSQRVDKEVTRRASVRGHSASVEVFRSMAYVWSFVSGKD